MSTTTTDNGPDEAVKSVEYGLRNLIHLTAAEQIKAMRVVEHTLYRNKFYELAESQVRFDYGYGPIVKEDHFDYNLLRHLGSAWMFQEVFGLRWPYENDRYLQFAMPACEFGYAEYEFLAETKKGRKREYPLGAQGFLLLLLGNSVHKDYLDDIAPASAPFRFKTCHISRIEKALEFICHSQTPWGDFHHKYNARGELMDFHSDYYTGEALFGLAAITNSPLFLEVDEKLQDLAVKTLIRGRERLLHHMEDPASSPLAVDSHWNFYALTEMLQSYLVPQSDGELPAIITQIMDRLLFTGYNILQTNDKGVEDNVCRLACRVEGILRFVEVYCAADPEHVRRPPFMIKRIMRFVANNINYIVESFDTLNQLFPFGKNGKNARSHRMDVNQHAIMAIHAYCEIIRKYPSFAYNGFNPRNHFGLMIDVKLLGSRVPLMPLINDDYYVSNEMLKEALRQRPVSEDDEEGEIDTHS